MLSDIQLNNVAQVFQCGSLIRVEAETLFDQVDQERVVSSMVSKPTELVYILFFTTMMQLHCLFFAFRYL